MNDILPNKTINTDLMLVNSASFIFWIFIFFIVGIFLIVIFLLSLRLFYRNNKVDDKIIGDCIDNIKKAENEFELKKQEIDKVKDERIKKIDVDKLKDDELIKADPLEYIRRKF